MTRRRAKKNSPPKLSDAEWDVMNVVWEHGPATAQQVFDHLAGAKEWSVRTVKTLLARLVKKGAATFDEDGRRYVYRAAVPRASCVRAESASFLQRVLGGDASPALAYFVREGKLTPDQIEKLRRLLDEEDAP